MATSSNPALLPEANIRVEWNKTAYTVTISPVPGEQGTAVVRLSVTDGLETARVVPDFTSAGNGAPPPNTPPAVSDFSNQTVPVGTPLVTIPFAVSDEESVASTLIVQVSSDDSSLLPPQGLSIEGTDTDRTLILRPAAGQSGTVTVTVTVGDGLLTTSKSFELTLGSGVPPPPPPPPPPNTAPFISEVPDQTIFSSTSYAIIPFTVGDADSAVETLTVQAFGDNPAVIPDVNMFVDGVTANRRLILWPPAGRTGTMTIALRVSDGQASSISSFAVTLAAQIPNALPYISSIADLTLPADAQLVSVPFTVSDAETPVDALTVVAVSDAQAVMPNANIAITGGGTNRTLTFRRLAGASGVALVSVFVGDGVLTTTRKFEVSVLPEPPPPPNTAPFVSEIPNQTIPSGVESVSIPFWVGDEESQPDTLTVVAWSGAPTIIPEANITVTGSGTNRTLVVRRLAGDGGIASLAVIVSDGVLSMTRPFEVTVLPDPPPPPPNTAPFISEIPNQTIASKAGSASISFTIGDAESPAENLTVQAFGDDPGLIADDDMLVDGSSSTRTLILMPSGRTGTMNVTVRVSDGQASTTRSFVVTLTAPPPNTVPSIASITDQILPENAGSVSVPFNVSDAETAADALILVAWSDDQSIIPDSNISMTGNGTNRTVTVRRMAGASGMTTISIIVGDGVYSVVTTFDITVEPEPVAPNTAPFVSPVANQVIPSDAGTVSISVNIGDAESPANALLVEAWADNASMIPDGNINVNGSGNERTLVIRTVPDITGTTTLDVSVSDGQLTTTTSFLVTVVPNPPLDGRLRIQSIHAPGPSAMTLTWSAESGEIYQVLARERVDQAYWHIISPKLVAYGTTLTWTDLGATSASRFYQIRKFETLSPLALPPRLLGVIPKSDGDIELRWTGRPGASYRVVAKDTADQSDWVPISGGLVADQAVVSWIDRDAWGFDYRFYKIELLP